MLFFVSCSSNNSSNDTNNNNSSQNLFLKKITEGDAVLGGSGSSYTYNGNKLVEILRTQSSYTSSDKYTYTGDLITKIEKYEVHYLGTSSESRTLISTDQFQYNNNNQLVQFKTTTPNSDYEDVTTYVYTNNNTVTFQQFENSPGTAPVSLKTGTITVQNGELVRVQVVKQFDSYTKDYTYDTYNSVFKNVLGYDKLMFSHIIGKQGSMTSLSTIIGGVSHNFTNGNGTLEYTYNTNNYPLIAKQKMGTTVLHTFNFEYY